MNAELWADPDYPMNYFEISNEDEEEDDNERDDDFYDFDERLDAYLELIG